jgi:type IV pilus assembly protein PilC
MPPRRPTPSPRCLEPQPDGGFHPGKNRQKGRTSGGKVALADLVIFTRQLATMMDAGLAMVQSLQALAEQTDNKVMRDVIKDVTTRVEGGDSFSEALQKHPKVFNKLYYSMVSAGEKGGLLAEILARLATYLENTARLRKKVKSAMMYPTVVTVVAIGITTFLLVKVVPPSPTFSRASAAAAGADAIPDQRQQCVAVHNFPYFILVGGGIMGGWLYYIKTPPDAGFGMPPHQAADLRPHRPQNLPGPFAAPWLRWCAAACPSWKCCPSCKTPSATSSWRRPSKSAATDIERGEGISAALGKHPVFPP